MPEARILLLYIFSRLPFPLGEEPLLWFLQGEKWIHYFETRQYLYDLCEAGFLENLDFDGVEQYALTERGRDSLEMFLARIPQPILRSLDARLAEAQETLREKSQIFTSIECLAPEEYRVDCAILENGRKILTLSALAASHDIALRIAGRWKKSAVNIYKELICPEE